MLISIVIPAYNPSLILLFDLLSSIRSQLAIDIREIEVVIVNDGGTSVPETFIHTFLPLNVREITLEHNSGPGIARQAGLDMAVGEYIMFCDADDVLHDVGVLSQLIQTIGDNDVLISGWMEEIKDESGSKYIMHTGDMTWMHGKLFRTSFLKDNDIRFHSDLRVHEDSYFLTLVKAHDARIENSNAVSYVWRWRDDSITRINDSSYTFKSAPIYVYSQSEANRQIQNINSDFLMQNVVADVCYIYWITHYGEWTEYEHSSDRMALWSAFKEHMSNYLRYWDVAPQSLKEESYENHRIQVGAPSLVYEESIYDWVERMRHDSNM